MDGGGLGESGGDVITLWRRNGYYAVWMSAAGIMAKVRDKPAYELSKTGAYPVISAQGPVVAAWEDNGRIRTERLD